ncbi:MAG: hypothetical protein QG595_1747, partial [Pseudomonadota bacterium]|nr:hypothetical protein [Pseudomonadota bacterium]
MTDRQTTTTMPLRQGFSIPDLRHDHWAQVAIIARAWAAAAARRDNTERFAADAHAALAEVEPLEAFSAFPGLRLMRVLRESLQEGDAQVFAHQAQRINAALSSGAFRRDEAFWEPGENAEIQAADYLPPTA